MKIYKYRELSQPNEQGFGRLERIIKNRVFWCARPDTLNDPDEFAWKCDFTASSDTADVLTELLVQVNGRTREQARPLVLSTIDEGRLRVLAEPVIENMIRQCRDEIGIACFGMSPNNETLWKRYAGEGAGICVELEAPEGLLGAQFHPVTYSDDRRIHVDDFLRARFDSRYAAVVYAASLLSKTTLWAPEEEIRFVSKRQRIEVAIDGSVITRVIVGPTVRPAAAERIRQIAGDIPVVTRGSVEGRSTKDMTGCVRRGRR